VKASAGRRAHFNYALGARSLASKLTTCLLCKRERAPSSTLCRYHLAAKRSVESAYRQWNEAYGGLAWKEYLRRISQDSETGEWAKEVAELLSKQDVE
jgi:hypothetical protein